MKTWIKQFQKNEGFSEKYDISNRKFKKIDPEKFLEYLKNNPDAFQRKIAANFSCGQAAIGKLMKK